VLFASCYESSFATVNPPSGTIKDFTTPIAYMVTAEDGSIQEYIVTIAIAPDTTPPTIIEYTFNGLADNFNVDFATTTPSIDIVLKASENVDWISVKIENQNIQTITRYFTQAPAVSMEG